MMGKKQHSQPKLYYHLSLEARVPADHPLRKIKELIDFSFVRPQVADCYGARGNTSVDPAVIMKLMFLLFYENIKSERQLASQLPMRLDWLWFCNYDVDDETPNHSVLSKARKRWGKAVFVEFFQSILQQCIDADLVDGTIIHVDSTMIDANASADKLKPQLRYYGNALYDQLDEQDTLSKRASKTDPDARLGKKSTQKSTFGYKDHRVVDDAHGIITTTITTPANVNDDKVLRQAVEEHEANTHQNIEITVADTIYGSIENYKMLHDKEILPCIPRQRYGGKTEDFSYDQFTYDKTNDCYRCPAGQVLTRYDKTPNQSVNGCRYRARREVCEQCNHFKQCVDSQTQGRQVTRNNDEPYVHWALHCMSQPQRKRLRQRRMAKAEGSFADGANNHGLKRSRWRRINKVEIQNLMIAAIQNLRKLLRLRGRKPANTVENQIGNGFIALRRAIRDVLNDQEQILNCKRALFCVLWPKISQL